MRNDKLYTKEEIELFRSIENGELKPLPPKEFEKEKKRLEVIAHETLKRKKI